MNWAIEKKGYSQRRACGLVGRAPRVHRYASRRGDDESVRERLRELAERVGNPKVPSARLHGTKERYKIKLRNAGYRLVYEVRDREVLVLVVAVGKRERNEVYGVAERRRSN